MGKIIKNEKKDCQNGNLMLEYSVCPTLGADPHWDVAKR